MFIKFSKINFFFITLIINALIIKINFILFLIIKFNNVKSLK